MAKTEHVDVVRLEGALFERQPDGTLKPLAGLSDWTRVDAMTDEEIERTAVSDPDTAPLSDEDWAKVEFVDPFKTPITIRVDTEVLDWFKSRGKRGYQTRMNAVLRRYMEAHRRSG